MKNIRTWFVMRIRGIVFMMVGIIAVRVVEANVRQLLKAQCLREFKKEKTKGEPRVEN